MAHLSMRLLFQARYVTFSAVVVLLVFLAWSAKRVTYDQSIASFFADDDPDMAVYQKAAATFGDDNFAFVVYDDPALLTPEGMDRVAELAAALGPDHMQGVQRVESIDAMPLLWAIDDAMLALDKLPAFARNFAKNAAQAHGQKHRPEIQLDDNRRGGAHRQDARPDHCAQRSPDSSSAHRGNPD